MPVRKDFPSLNNYNLSLSTVAILGWLVDPAEKGLWGGSRPSLVEKLFPNVPRSHLVCGCVTVLVNCGSYLATPVGYGAKFCHQWQTLLKCQGPVGYRSSVFMSERASLQHDRGEWGVAGESFSLFSFWLRASGMEGWSPSQEPLSRPEAAWKPFGLVGSHECQPLWQQQVWANHSQVQQHSVITLRCITHLEGTQFLTFFWELYYRASFPTSECKWRFQGSWWIGISEEVRRMSETKALLAWASCFYNQVMQKPNFPANFNDAL